MIFKICTNAPAYLLVVNSSDKDFLDFDNNNVNDAFDNGRQACL